MTTQEFMKVWGCDFQLCEQPDMLIALNALIKEAQREAWNDAINEGVCRTSNLDCLDWMLFEDWYKQQEK